MNINTKFYVVSLIIIFLMILFIKMYQSGRYEWSIWIEDGALNIAGPPRHHPYSDQARELALECQYFDEKWKDNPPRNHHEKHIRDSDLERCFEGQLREIKRLERNH